MPSVPPRVRTGALLVATAIAASAALAIPAGAAVAAAAPCRVVNVSKAAKPTYAKLQNAIDAASPGQTLSITGTCAGSFTIDKSLKLREGPKPGILSGGGSQRILTVVAGKVAITGLTLRRGLAPACESYSGYVCGGALFNDGAVTLTGVTIRDTHGVGDDSLSVYGSAIMNNVDATLRIIRSTIVSNTATAGANQQADAAIANDGTLVIRRSLFADNVSTGPTAYGGAIYAYDPGATLTISDSTFSRNLVRGETEAEGGAIEYDGASQLRILRTTFDGNEATTSQGDDGLGGALLLSGEDVLIRDSTFTGNRADGDGGAIDAATPFTVLGSTVARNSSAAGAGGIAADDTASIGSSIIARNKGAGATRDCDLTDPASSLGFNLIGVGDGCTAFANGVRHDQVGSSASPRNPKLGTLARNGGPTKTLALLAGSPALNAAGAKPCDTATDQRGVKRPQGAKCDIGAYERRP